MNYYILYNNLDNMLDEYPSMRRITIKSNKIKKLDGKILRSSLHVRSKLYSSISRIHGRL